MKNSITLCFSIILCHLALAQTTVGLFMNDEQAYNGYTLYAGNSNTKTFLIDNCGYIVNEWNGTEWPELSVYLLEDGSLLRPSWGYIEKRDWNDNLTWSYNLAENDIYNHHDIEPLPNGNILIIHTRGHDADDIIALGRNPNQIEDIGEIDGIIEIQPNGTNDATVVWEWNALDHTVQNIDPSLSNYGNLEDHPELLDINFSLWSDGGMWDWLHCNGLDYNAELDQIIFSSRHTSEIYIIDHSTTTAEAASHEGGAQGKGGDFLWRWGNPQHYNAGTEDDRKLFGQHDPKWVPAGYPDEGKVSVFNNGFQRDGEYSSIHRIDSEVNADGSYNLTNGSFSPDDYHWSWNGTVLGETMLGEIESGVNIQPNGNMLICEFWGRFSEVTPEGDVVWVYRNPVAQQIIQQGGFGFADVFRAEKYPPDYAAFIDKDLSPSGLVEGTNVNSAACSIFDNPTSLEHYTLEEPIFSIYPNPTKDILYIDIKVNALWKIMDLDGRSLLEGREAIVDVSELTPGIYFISVFSETLQTSQKLIIE